VIFYRCTLLLLLSIFQFLGGVDIHHPYLCPCQVLGGVGGSEFTVGIQVMSTDITPDHIHDTTVEFYDVPAAPKHPLLSQ
jgi:hypothetical protein